MREESDILSHVGFIVASFHAALSICRKALSSLALLVLCLREFGPVPVIWMHLSAALKCALCGANGTEAPVHLLQVGTLEAQQLNRVRGSEAAVLAAMLTYAAATHTGHDLQHIKKLFRDNKGRVRSGKAQLINGPVELA